MKNTILFFLLLICTTSNAQTSIFREIFSNVNPPEEYILKNGEAKEITVTKVYNPDDDDRFVDVTTYDFRNSDHIKSELKRDEEIISKEIFILDSLNRIIKSRENFKHRSIGWKKTNIDYTYSERLKVMKILYNDGSLKEKLIIEYDSLRNPISINTLTASGLYSGLATAKYDYINNSFDYKLYDSDSVQVASRKDNINLNYIIKKNDFGDIIEQYVATAPLEANSRLFIDYKYDKKGNWTCKLPLIRTV